jgi:integrase/recombinase XerD
MAQAKTLTPAEQLKVLHYITTSTFPQRDRCMFLITTLAGLRVGDLASLTISDVRNSDGTVRAEVFLDAQRVKYQHSRTVYLNQRLQAELTEYIATRTWFTQDQPLFNTFRGPRHGFTANTLSQHFHYMYKRAGITGASSHSGRRTFITTLANKGVSVRLLASLAGHRCIATTQRYIDVNDDMKRSAVELV